MKHRRFASLVVLLLLCSGVLSAQTTRGDIRGIVVDDDGAPLPGVSIGLESDALLGTHTKKRWRTGEDMAPFGTPGFLWANNNNRDPEVRCAAIEAARAVGPEFSEDTLAMLLTDESPRVRGAAARALAFYSS